MINNEEIENAIYGVISDSLQRFPAEMQVFIAKYLSNSGGYAGESSRATVFKAKSAKLSSVSGKLFQSFIKGRPNNIYRVTGDKDNLELEYGTNLIYARIHEEGGFIKSKGKMQWFTAFQYKQTKSPFWAKITGAIIRDGGIKIPKRAYFKPALKDWEASGKPEYKKRIVTEIVKELNRCLDKNRF